MYLCTSILIFYIVAVPCVSSAFSERKLLCSSEEFSFWYSFEGELHFVFVLVMNFQCSKLIAKLSFLVCFRSNLAVY